MPNTIHQQILTGLLTNLSVYADKEQFELLSAPVAVFLKNDEYTYVEPDLCIICDKSKLNDRGCNGAPDWIIEITSANTATYDHVTKLELYFFDRSERILDCRSVE